MWRNYGQETRPDGDWVRTTGMLSVLGLEQHLAGFKAFADAAHAASKKGLCFGVDIEAEVPDDPSQGLRVIGVAQSKGFLGGVKAHQWVLGRIWEVVAEEVYEDLISKGVRVASELSSIHYDMTEPEVKIWGKSQQQRPLDDVCKAARLHPPASFHVLRHTYASHLAMGGVPLQVIATNLGHADTRMVEKHYGHLAPSFMADAIRGAGLGYVVPVRDTNVKPLRAR